MGAAMPVDPVGIVPGLGTGDEGAGAADPGFVVDFNDAVLGAGLPAEIEALIARAGGERADPDAAERLLLEARRRAPAHPATLIALYRHYFYAHRLAAARALAAQAIAFSEAGFASGRRDLRTDAGARFHLFALKGYAYLSLRLGDIEAGRGALERLRILDPGDFVGGAVLLRVLARQAAGEDDADPAGAEAPSAPRGWPDGDRDAP